MQKNLFDFANQNREEQQHFETKGGSANADFEHKDNGENLNDNLNFQEQAKKVYEKYQNYSQDDLMSEFLKTSKQKLREGVLTQEKLQNTVNSLTPFLNNTQKEFLKGLIDKLND